MSQDARVLPGRAFCMPSLNSSWTPTVFLDPISGLRTCQTRINNGLSKTVFPRNDFITVDTVPLTHAFVRTCLDWDIDAVMGTRHEDFFSLVVPGSNTRAAEPVSLPSRLPVSAIRGTSSPDALKSYKASHDLRVDASRRFATITIRGSSKDDPLIPSHPILDCSFANPADEAETQPSWCRRLYSADPAAPQCRETSLVFVH